jgi:hypothetical protein
VTSMVRFGPRLRDVMRAVGRIGAVTPIASTPAVDRVDERVGGFESGPDDWQETLVPQPLTSLWERRARERGVLGGGMTYGAGLSARTPAPRQSDESQSVFSEPIALTLARLVNAPGSGPELRGRIARIWAECDQYLPASGVRSNGDPERRHMVNMATQTVATLQAVWELGATLTLGTAPLGMPAPGDDARDPEDVAAHGVYLLLTIVQHADSERCEAAVASLEASLGRTTARARVRDAIGSLPLDFWRDVHGDSAERAITGVLEALSPEMVSRVPSRNERILRAWLAGRTG